MGYKHQLPDQLRNKAAKELKEFTNGGMQVHLLLADGSVVPKVLVSACQWILSAADRSNLGFSVVDIVDIYQTVDDLKASRDDCWLFLDDAVDPGSESVDFILSMERRGHLEVSPKYQKLLRNHQC